MFIFTYFVVVSVVAAKSVCTGKANTQGLSFVGGAGKWTTLWPEICINCVTFLALCWTLKLFAVVVVILRRVVAGCIVFHGLLFSPQHWMQSMQLCYLLPSPFLFIFDDVSWTCLRVLTAEWSRITEANEIFYIIVSVWRLSYLSILFCIVIIVYLKVQKMASWKIFRQKKWKHNKRKLKREYTSGRE